jgi:hypothetical protein
MFAAIRRASSRVSRCAAVRRPIHTIKQCITTILAELLYDLPRARGGARGRGRNLVWCFDPVLAAAIRANGGGTVANGKARTRAGQRRICAVVAKFQKSTQHPADAVGPTHCLSAAMQNMLMATVN